MSSLEPLHCFTDVENKELYYDYTYCVGNLVILACSGVNVVLLTVMLAWHLSDKS
jgi:hypothetical protein